MEIVIKWIPFFLASLNRVYGTSFNMFLMARSPCCEHQLYHWAVIQGVLRDW